MLLKLPVVNAVWIGPRMGRIHAACLSSFVQTDHKVILHTYEPVADAPPGVEIRDASLLLPRDKLVRHAKNGSYAISGDLIRHQIQKLGLGLYVDCDVFCLRPLEDADTILGWEDRLAINSAVLKLPADSPVTAALARIKEGWVPPWLKDQPALPLSEYPWGTTGPQAITRFARKFQIADKAFPYDVLFPVHYRHWPLLFDPNLTIEDVTTHRTRYVHLWSHMSEAAGEPPRTSPVGRMLDRVESRGWRRLMGTMAGKFRR